MRLIRLLTAGAISLAVLGTGADAQKTEVPHTPVKWSLSLAPDTRAQAGAIFAALVTARINAGWHLYAIDQPDGGPIAMTLGLPAGQPFSLGGAVHQPARLSLKDPNFGLTTQYFENLATFTVPVRVAAGTTTGRQTVHVTVTYQACSEKVCLPRATVNLTTSVGINAALPKKPGDPSDPNEPSLSRAVEARATPDPAAKLEALATVRREFAGKPVFDNFSALVDEATLTTLYRNFPERTDAIDAALLRAIESRVASRGAEFRLERLVGPLFQADVVSDLIERKLALNRLDTVLLEAIQAVGTGRPEKRALALYRLGRIAYAQEQIPLGDARFREALSVAPDVADASTEVIAYYLKAGAETKAADVVRQLIHEHPGSEVAAAGTVVLAGAFEKRNQDADAERWLADAVSAFPRRIDVAPGKGVASAMAALARLEAKRGANAAALDHYMLVAATRDTREIGTDMLRDMRALYRKVHGSDAGLDEALDVIAKPMNPVEPEPYRPTAARTDRTVLVEEFTGAGCSPCIGASLAIDAIIGRYEPSDVVVITYHASVPPPDPFVVSGGQGRARYYHVDAVPSLLFDGALDAVDGGAREDAARIYDVSSRNIDKTLETPAAARVDVHANVAGDTVRARASVSNLPSGAETLRLHLVLVEREVRYGAENGIRWHSMVVRAVAGDHGEGLPIRADGTFDHDFSLHAIQDDVVATLAKEVQGRRENHARNGTAPRILYAENHAVTAIDPGNLVIVAFVQDDATKRVLQAVQANVVVVTAQTSKQNQHGVLTPPSHGPATVALRGGR